MTDIRKAARWSTWVTSGVLLLILYRAEGLDGSRVSAPAVQRVAYLASVGAWLVTAWLLGRPPRRAWQRRALALTLGAVTLGATVALTLIVPADLQHTSANWAVGVNGWLLLTIASGGPLSVLLPTLTVPVLVALAAAVPAGSAEVVVMTARALGILGLQLPLALATRAMDQSAEAASAQHLTQEAIRTEQIVAAALHDDRVRRSRTVAAAVEPVLASLAAGTEETGPDDTLRQRSRVAAARVRRLLTEWHGAGGDPLGDDLSACLDEVQAAGIRVDVAVHADGLPPALRRAAGDVVRRMARLPVTRLRLTAVPTATHICLSVVARTTDAGGQLALGAAPAPLTIRTTAVDDTLWVELTCPV